ncbi:LysR substrate-binding domain-containing protein, partial [Pseudomonas aeruginosa]
GIDCDTLSPRFSWRFQHDGKLSTLRPKRARLATNAADARVYAALAGLGISYLPTWLCCEYLLRGELQALFCDDCLPAAEPTCFYALRLELEASSRTRLLLSFLRERFGFPPPWDQALQQRLGER